MKHLDSYRFYELAAKLNGLFRGTAQGRIVDMFTPLTEAQNSLDSWIKGEVFALESSKAEATKLLNKMGAIFNRYYIDPNTKQLRKPTGEDRIDAQEMAIIANMLEKFEHALAAELNRAPIYLVSKCGIYSTYDLIENARNCFSDTLRKIIPESSLHEFDMAGRSLAFGLSTAATMHLLRAVEIVLKMYYEKFSGQDVARNERSYAIYLKRLAVLADDEANAYRPDKRLLQMLAQIKEHYRNPLMNSDSSFSSDKALALFGLATAAMTLMCEEITRSPSERKESDAEQALSSVVDVAKDEDEAEEGDKKATPAPKQQGKKAG